MLNNSIWNIFKKTGNIEAILYLNRFKDIKNERIAEQKVEKIAVNATNQV